MRAVNKVPMNPLATSADLRAVSGAMSCYFDCTLTNDAVQDVAAAFQQDLQDLMDVGREIDATHRREFEVGVFEHVNELKRLGAIVAVGIRRHYMKVANKDPVPWVSLYVIVSAKQDVKQVLLIEKDQRVSIT